MEQLTDFITRRNYINFYLSGSCKHRNQPSYLHVFVGREPERCRWQKERWRSVCSGRQETSLLCQAKFLPGTAIGQGECDVANRIPPNVANNNTFSLGERIATPVCALVRNDVRFMKLTVKRKFVRYKALYGMNKNHIGIWVSCHN